MSNFTVAPVPTGLQSSLSLFLLDVKKRLDVLGGATSDQLMSKQDLIDIGLITTTGRIPDDTADRTIFVLTPTTPYKVGDIWVQDDALYRCQVARLTGTYNSDDWLQYADKTSDNGQDYDWITGAKPDVDADNTQSALTLGAAIDNAKANGKTLIVGGYIDTDIVKVNSSLIVGNVDFSTQVGGTEKPANNADVTGLNTAANTSSVGSYSASVYSNWVSGGTYINGGYIATNTISLNRIVGNDGASVSFSNSTSMVFQDGADLELQSSYDATAMLKFTRGTYTYDFRTLTSGAYLIIAGRTTATGIQIGDGTYTRYVNIQPTYSGELLAGSISGTHYGFIADNSGSNAYIQAFTTSTQGVNYVATQTYFRPSPNGGASYPTLGGSGANQWANVYSVLLNISSTATMNAINASGQVSITGTTYTRTLYTYSVLPRAATYQAATWATPFDYIYGDDIVAKSRVTINRETPESYRTLLIGTDDTSGSHYSIMAWDYTGSSQIFSVANDGTVYSANNSYTGSDRILKDNIKDIDELLLPKILQFNFKDYSLKIDGKNKKGIIAQEAKKIAPDLVNFFVENEETKEGVYGFDYGGLSVYNSVSIQEHQAYIDSIVDRLETIESVLLSKN